MFIACACARWSQLSGDPAPTYALLSCVYGHPPLRPFLGLGVPPSLRSVSLSLKKVVLSRGNPCSIEIKKLSLHMKNCLSWFKVIMFCLGEIIFRRRMFIVDTFHYAKWKYGLKD